MEASIATNPVEPITALPSEGANITLVTKTRRVGLLRVLGYCLTTGDFNLIHLFSSVARRVGFEGRFAHGGLVQGIAKDLIRRSEKAMTDRGIPMITKEDWEFKHPVYFGDQIVVFYTIRYRSNGKGNLVRIKASVQRQTPKGPPEVVTEGTLCGLIKPR